MMTSADRYVRFIALGENGRILKVKVNGRNLFQLLFRHSSEQKDENLSRERERVRERETERVLTEIR
jgi:hypothetical protein